MRPKSAAAQQRVLVSTRINRDLLREAKHLAIERETTLNSIIEEALRGLLEAYRTQKAA